MVRGPVRAIATLVVTGACTAYVLWKIDLPEAVRILAGAQVGYFALAVALTISATLPFAWRWKRLLAARGTNDGLGWLTRTYFVSYAVGQVLPTSLGGDASRIYEASRRHPGAGGPIAGSVILERVLGGAATLLLASIGFALAVGHYDVGAYVWIEGAFVIATLIGGIILFSRSARRPLARTVPLFRWLRLERYVRLVYEGVHGYRRHARLVVAMFLLTTVVQVFRVLAIWLAAKSVGVDLSPRPFFVMGPLLFLVMLVPFTINGFAVREAFFVSFLTKLGVSADAAFAVGFLFFLVYVGTALPGVCILLVENVGGPTSSQAPRGERI